MSNVQLPEPAILLPEGKWRFEVIGPMNGTIYHCPVYTEAQLKRYGDDRAREALEMAALMLESLHKNDQTNILYGVKAIRELAKEIK